MSKIVEANLTHVLTVMTSLVAITIIAVVYLLRGGDGLAMTGAFTMVGTILGFAFGTNSQMQELPAK